ncbi:MAG: ferritin-like domain-containing protein [Gemmatimonadota bacterium]
MTGTGAEGEGGTGTKSGEVISGLNDLLQLDHDAIGAYDIAVEQLENREHALQIEGFKRDHERHIRELNDLILELGGAPTNEPHATAPLKQAIQRVAKGGGDTALLTAWRANELQVMTKYDSYAQKALFWGPAAKRVVDQNALDEERHYSWVVGLMGQAEAPELHIANRMREGVSRARHFGEHAQERLGNAAEIARLRAAQGLEVAAEQLDQVASREAAAAGFRGTAADGAQRVARGLESGASYLRRGSGAGGDLRASVEGEVRGNPVRALLATFAIGFVLGRILR